MANQPGKGLRRLIKATGHTWAGLKTAWSNEQAFRQESILCLILSPLALWLGDNGAERILLIGSLLILIVVELLNSGIEAVVDRIGMEYHELSGRAKDLSSAAVFMALLNAVLVWILILLDF